MRATGGRPPSHRAPRPAPRPLLLACACSHTPPGAGIGAGGAWAGGWGGGACAPIASLLTRQRRPHPVVARRLRRSPRGRRREGPADHGGEESVGGGRKGGSVFERPFVRLRFLFMAWGGVGNKSPPTAAPRLCEKNVLCRHVSVVVVGGGWPGSLSLSPLGNNAEKTPPPPSQDTRIKKDRDVPHTHSLSPPPHRALYANSAISATWSDDHRSDGSPPPPRTPAPGSRSASSGSSSSAVGVSASALYST